MRFPLSWPPSGRAALSFLTASLCLPALAQDPSDSVSWRYDPLADVVQVSATVPLRVVMVGFDPDAAQDGFTAEELFREIPDHQRVGVLNRYEEDNIDGAASSGNDTDLLGLDTLVNHGRGYYRGQPPQLLPIEYRWEPELIYAPPEFAEAMFAAMVANSVVAEPNGPSQADFITEYNATRGSALRVAASGDQAQAVMTLNQRMINGPAVEDWMAENVGKFLPFEANNDIDNVGYTVFFLNTWDSPAALSQFPKGEYHNWYIERIDPDDNSFDGIDWGRVWGGRYRFMMVDMGAAPNVYEEETWAGGEGRLGSTAYDPPLWEYRAEAPRPFTPVFLADGMEQAVTPGENWDRDQLAYMMGRTVNQAVNFRFFHSYLYEPRPGTGRFFLSDNVWHDAQSEQPFPTDLTKLYDQEVALAGLRSLTPYFEFDGNVEYEYLALPPAGEEENYAADQAALDQAKQDGDDIAGAPHVSMHTNTMMDYLDSKPERFLRGGGCFTTVPTISVVVPFHYAWALPVAAGIATNRNGVPWGFLQSVNDVTKYDESGRDETTNLYHINPRYSGSFTYTVVHEASHYMGLAHPHDTIGAVRGADGEPVYYDGFTWTYNSTASPTTYSHVELVYGVLDQESIARGHTGFYLKWTDEALKSAGGGLIKQGIRTIGDMPPAWAELRATAVAKNSEAEQRFASFDFVGAAFASRDAWLAAATLRDLARDLPLGTTQLERNTLSAMAAQDPAACQDDVPSRSGVFDAPVSEDAMHFDMAARATRGGVTGWPLLLLVSVLLGIRRRR